MGRYTTLKKVIEQTDTTPGKIFMATIQALIVFSLVTFSMETLPGLSAECRCWLRRAEIVTVAVFTCEYLVRLLIADSRPDFIFSFFGIVDLLAILPFYISAGVDLRDRITKYRRIWDDAMEACLKRGAAISHHHGSGMLKQAYMAREHGESFKVISALKNAFDPTGIMNPGKLGL